MSPQADDRDEHGGRFTLGLRDLYAEIQRALDAVHSLSTKLDTALIAQTMAQQATAQQLTNLRHELNDHESRLREQERRQVVTPKSMWTAIGVLTSVSGVLFGILQLLIK